VKMPKCDIASYLVEVSPSQAVGRLGPMNVLTCAIPGCISNQVVRRRPRLFRETGPAPLMEAGLDVNRADNVSFSRRGILRGLALSESKAQGNAPGVAGEVRRSGDIGAAQPTFGNAWPRYSLREQATVLTSGRLAHGFVVLSETASSVQVHRFYSPEGQMAIRWMIRTLASSGREEPAALRAGYQACAARRAAERLLHDSGTDHICWLGDGRSAGNCAAPGADARSRAGFHPILTDQRLLLQAGWGNQPILSNAAAYTAWTRRSRRSQGNEHQRVAREYAGIEESGCLLVHSTDYIFDGAKTQPNGDGPAKTVGRLRAHRNCRGRSVRAVGGAHLIFRSAGSMAARAEFHAHHMRLRATREAAGGGLTR